MTAKEIRNQFFDYFKNKGHKIVPSAPIVNKNDPSLMFINAGMNQFKDYFLGNKKSDVRRIADTQKCLRVSGKHNDLEEVGLDSYHHTMFEMLGNWSFGDYFKKEAIEWAWDLLTNLYDLPEDRLYVTVFSGDLDDGLEKDDETANYWSEWLPKERILYFDRKDNFWEMGDTGPCGPCSEIHIDLRTDEERKHLGGEKLINKDHPLVVEIWNLVFIQFDRKADRSLVNLPEKHVDTGMGFERLCMAVQGKLSNYDTDLFVPFIEYVEKETGETYDYSYDPKAKKDIAFRVIVDHIRAVAFTIADGQLPGNTGAGYVIRRILRRAVRYYYSFLNRKEPLLYKIIPLLSHFFAEVFPELEAQKDFVQKIVLEEEKSFLRTLELGLKRIDHLEISDNLLAGDQAFELYDTYGFPIDLTRLIGQEEGWTVDEKGFSNALSKQKERSREDALKEEGDWIEVYPSDRVEFIGYEHLLVPDSRIIKYRKIKKKDKILYQLVLNKTPFYAESGGQVGDLGVLTSGDVDVKVMDTQKENDLIVHLVDKLPPEINNPLTARVYEGRRTLIENNHTATHLLHAALREVLGDHVHQRGSLVNEKHFRFDFSHFEKVSDEKIREIEGIVNRKIRENIPRIERRNVPIQEARSTGAMMLFGEKYGEFVRMIIFGSDYSVELCGGCHVDATGDIGMFKIKSESAVASGVRRIEAVTAREAMSYTDSLIGELNQIKSLFKNPTNTIKHISDLLQQNKDLEKEIYILKSEKIKRIKKTLLSEFEKLGSVNFLASTLDNMSINDAKTLAYNLEKEKGDAIILLGLVNGDKVNLQLVISKALIDDTLDAGKLIKKIARHIRGGGGGQAFYATAGGTDPKGLDRAFTALREELTLFE